MKGKQWKTGDDTRLLYRVTATDKKTGKHDIFNLTWIGDVIKFASSVHTRGKTVKIDKIFIRTITKETRYDVTSEFVKDN